jgi:hypothetical protein
MMLKLAGIVFMLISQLSYQSNCSQTDKLFHIFIDNQEAESLSKRVGQLTDSLILQVHLPRHTFDLQLKSTIHFAYLGRCLI